MQWEKSDADCGLPVSKSIQIDRVKTNHLSCITYVLVHSFSFEAYCFLAQTNATGRQHIELFELGSNTAITFLVNRYSASWLW